MFTLEEKLNWIAISLLGESDCTEGCIQLALHVLQFAAFMS
jgi:hypothetical protein